MTVCLNYTESAIYGWHMRLQFSRGSQAGASGALKPGECAWADRPLTPEEPTTLFYQGHERWSMNRMFFEAKTRRFTEFRFLGAEGPAAHELFQKATTEGQLFYVHCYHQNQVGAPGSLIVTKVGP